MSDITLTRDETKRLEECLKDKTFRDLLGDYVREISNPTTKLAHEQYLTELESQGGAPANRKLMKPKPEFCIKAKLVAKKKAKTMQAAGAAFVFINVCSGDLVEKAKLANPGAAGGNKTAGLCWQVPYILGHQRFDPEDEDGSMIFDIAFAESTLRLSAKQETLKRVLLQTAIEAVEGAVPQYKLKQDSVSRKARGDAPPMMSVTVTSPDSSSQSKDNKATKATKAKKTLKANKASEAIVTTQSNKKSDISSIPKRHYRDIVYTVSEDTSSGEIHITSNKIEHVCGIKQVHPEMNHHQSTLCVTIKDKKNVKVTNVNVIDLSNYKVIPSTMTASWYTKKQQLKITCGIRKKNINDTATLLLPAETERRTSREQRKPFMEKFVIDRRDHLEKTALCVKVENILESSLSVDFKHATQVSVRFETHTHRYFKVVDFAPRKIDVDNSRFDLNSRNLLIMLLFK